MLVPMAKVEIIGPKSDFHDVISLLHEEGKVHIQDLSEKIMSGELALSRMEVQGHDVELYEELEDLLIRVRAILRVLSDPDGGPEAATNALEYHRLEQMEPDELVEHVTSTIVDVEAASADLAEKHLAIDGEMAMLARYERILGKIQPLARQIVVTGAFDSVALLVERRYKAGLEHLQAGLSKITNAQSEIISEDIDEDTTAAIVVFARQYAEAVHKFLAMENVNQIRLPEDFSDLPMDIAYETITSRRAELPVELEKVRSELADLSREWHMKLVAARDVLIDKADEIVAIPMFGGTELAFVVDGWVPAGDIGTLTAMLQERFGKEVIVTQLAIDERDFADAPISLKNPRWAKPFETLMGFMGSPQYGTYDPTWMLAIFYPLFFGMIVGDIGYGLIMLGTVIWLRMKYRDNDGIQLATGILGPAATSAVFFGFIYGEFFGNVLTEYTHMVQPLYSLNGEFAVGPVPPGGVQILPFVRTAQDMLPAFLFIAVGIGLLQVLLGLALGVYNGIRTKHWSHVYEKGGLFAFVVGFVALILGVVFAEALSNAALWVQFVGGLTLFLGLLYAIKGGKFLGVVESITSLANVASYLRIMAVGLAGAIFADAVNGIAANMGNVWLGIAIAIPLQSLNFAIAAFSPNIHAVRLNFLEFFGKFYESSNKDYKPFHKTGGEKNQ